MRYYIYNQETEEYLVDVRYSYEVDVSPVTNRTYPVSWVVTANKDKATRWCLPYGLASMIATDLTMVQKEKYVLIDLDAVKSVKLTIKVKNGEQCLV